MPRTRQKTKTIVETPVEEVKEEAPEAEVEEVILVSSGEHGRSERIEISDEELEEEARSFAAESPEPRHEPEQKKVKFETDYQREQFEKIMASIALQEERKVKKARLLEMPSEIVALQALAALSLGLQLYIAYKIQ